MRILLLTDIHGNFQALQAVVQDGENRVRLEAVWNMGDIVGYGPEPGGCIQFLRERSAVTVPGNHDLAAINRIPLTDFNPYAAAACAWTAEQLTGDERAYLESLPLRIQADQFTLVHGSPRDPVWEYVLSTIIAAANFHHFETPFCLVGHTHIPAIYVDTRVDGKGTCHGYHLVPEESLSLPRNARIIYNPGGVGQPRDGDPRASYGVYDRDAAAITHYRVPYDYRTTQELMRGAGLPDYLAERLALGR